MSPRKGEIGKRQIDREWRYQVEIVVPGSGLRQRLDGIAAYMVNRDCKDRPARDGARDAMRVCWRTADEARAFQALFGGELVVVPEWRR